jgi:hypothetical protein
MASRVFSTAATWLRTAVIFMSTYLHEHTYAHTQDKGAP